MENKPVGAELEESRKDAHIGPRAEAVEASGIRHQASGDGGNGLPRPSGPRNDKNGKKPEKGRGWVTRFFYPIICVLLLTFMRFYHWPIFKGRKKLPEGPCVICGNHSGFADPLWVFQLLGPKLLPWTMARKSLFEKSAFARNFLLTFRAFPVDRDNVDLPAVKKALSVLRNGEKLLIFPEGTRIKKGKKSEPKSGAVLLAQRAGVPLVPVYITHGRKPFQPIKVVMGEAYTPDWSCRRPDGDELEEKTTELMGKVYALGKL